VSRIADRSPAVVQLTSRLSRADLLWVANTAHGPAGHWFARANAGQPDHDHLTDAASTHRYLADHRVPVPADPPDAAALRDLAAIRNVVQDLADGNAGGWTPEAAALLADARFALGPTGSIGASTGGWQGFVHDLVVPLIGLMADGTTLQRCSNPLCRLVFEDASRNHSRRWCDNAGCGNRDRVKRARSTASAAA
jgi:predicted RNA-binding Zn ribbon-like protein